MKFLTRRRIWLPSSCTLPTVEQPLRVAEFDALFVRALREVTRTGPTAVRLADTLAHRARALMPV
ncbi:hypothetical protein SAMN05892883_2423 [Jatrophihabitans sp. GAS493]|uniref:hypothetical protein n=1 Tax=Jatrophihabitans sp. GAS493 TaxID=1907575 RepID=UPI000BB6CC0A|nr:hypothetical protein [Jatrophihabitans sp. GAS493]SOD73134.1 hypothetical protein SAMN05892883_2423 [Jatrophihabitans sp. GAS493]